MLPTYQRRPLYELPFWMVRAQSLAQTKIPGNYEQPSSKSDCRGNEPAREFNSDSIPKNCASDRPEQ